MSEELLQYLRGWGCWMFWDHSWRYSNERCTRFCLNCGKLQELSPSCGQWWTRGYLSRVQIAQIVLADLDHHSTLELHKLVMGL